MSAGERPDVTRDFSPDEVPLVGTHLVEAGAGTGKTYAIVGLFVRLLLERELDVSQILVVTYTIAATAELRGRIRRRLAELSRELAPGPDRDRVRAALHGFDAAAVFTIHGFCQRVLRERAFESGTSFESEVVSDADGLLEEVAQDFWMRELVDADEAWVGYLQETRWWPGRLATLAAQASARPDLVLRPAPGPVPDVERAEATRRDAFRELARAWRADDGAALDLLVQGVADERMNKNGYQPAAVAALRAAMDREMAAGDAARGLEARVPNLKRLGRDYVEGKTRKGKVAPVHPLYDLCDALLAAEAAVDEALRARLVAFLHDFVTWARDELLRRKRERNVLSFDDLLLRLSQALEGEGGDALAAAVRRRYPVALIDEFQDTDPVQYGIFRRVWQSEPDTTLFLIGDPKQAIYGFRGADVFAYLAARAGAGGVHGLSRNWRADPALIRGLNALFAAGERPFLLDQIPYAPAEPRPDAHDALRGARIASGLRVLELQDEQGEPAGKLTGEWRHRGLAAAVAGEAARILGAGQEIDGRRLAPRDLAILTRTNGQARDVQVALRAVGVAAVLQSEESVFATDEARELERVLRAVADPDDPARVRAAVSTTLLGTSSDDCLALAVADDAAGPGRAAEDAFEQWVGDLRDCRRIWTEQGLPRALRHLWTSRAVTERLLARADGERRVTNLHHLIELLHREASEARLGPLSLLYWFGRRRAEARAGGRVVAEEAQLRLESDDDAVRLLTVHRAKGLEFPVVLCPFLWDGRLARPNDEFRRFHDDRSRLSIEPTQPPELKSEEGTRLANVEAFGESLRLAYVALTRAEHHCSVVWGPFEKFSTSPLRHLVAPEPSPGTTDSEKGGRLQEACDAFRAGLASVAAEAGEGLRVERMELAPGPRVSPAEAAAGETPPLAARVASRGFGAFFRVSSFSGLVAQAAEERSGPGRVAVEVEEGRDHDATAGEGEAGARASSPPDGSGAEVRLARFPAGALPGTVIHEIFEETDFQQLGDLDARVGARLRARDLPASWTGPLAEAIREVLAVPLDPADPDSALERLSRANRIDEMPFMLPVATRDDAAERLDPGRLAAVFEAHAENDLVRGYARRAARLGFAPLAGYLRGFVDLVFRRSGRFYLADYKSNHLGARPEAYGTAQMAVAMQEHDYVLQYHLYLVALHRHLQQRLPGYDYDAHLGGAYYLFLRGMAPGHPPGTGVLFDRPPRPLVEALSELLS